MGDRRASSGINWLGRGIERLLVLVVLSVALACAAAPQQTAAPADWSMFGQGYSNTRAQPLETVISRESASRLKVKWSVKLVGNVLATPAIQDGALYVPDTDGYVYKLDTATGAILWQQKVDEITGFSGDWSRTTPFLTPSSLIIGNQNSCPKILPGGGNGPIEDCGRAVVIALDRATGALVWKRQIDDFPGTVVTQSPVVWGNHVLVGVSSSEESMAAAIDDYRCCEFKGRLVSLAAVDGAPDKEFQTVPDADGYSGGAIWGGTVVVDAARDSIYLATGNNYSVPKSVEACIAQCVARGCNSAQTRACARPIPGNYMESIVALDGLFEVKWSFEALVYDASNYACYTANNHGNCPEPMGPDFDFAQGPMLFDVAATGKQLLGAGQKSGWFFALDPETGKLVWKTRVGPGGDLGGMMWGSATDGTRVYTASANSIRNYWILEGKGSQAGFAINRGFWSALDAATGEILWQTPEPNLPALLAPVTNRENAYGPKGPVTVANGVVFGGTTSPGGDDLFALDAATGNVLWRYATGATVSAGAAVVDGVVYWGALAPVAAEGEGHSAYGNDAILPAGDATLFAFCVAGTEGCPD